MIGFQGTGCAASEIPGGASEIVQGFYRTGLLTQLVSIQQAVGCLMLLLSRQLSKKDISIYFYCARRTGGKGT